MKNKFPIYVVSKGRYSNMLTSRALDEIGAVHYVVVEASEYELYSKSDKCFGEVIVLPEQYKKGYDTCDNLGLSKSTGPGPARNFCIDHSIQQGFSSHWVMDDNIDAFHYLNRNEKFEVRTTSTLAASESFISRYSNVPVAGLNYYSFCKKTDSVPAFTANTRVYSCLLINNLAGYRWRARYNEDTDLCLRVLKDGLCTIQFNAFLCGKITTQRMRGGNSKDFYDSEGTYNKSKMLVDLHPDVARLTTKFNRCHHHVDYRPFKQNKLIRVDDIISEPKVNNYGMILVESTDVVKHASVHL